MSSRCACAWQLAATLAGVVALSGCTTSHPLQASAADSGAPALTSAQLLAAVQGDADTLDQSQDSAARAQLVAAATASAQRCLVQAPNDAACHYAQAQVLGLTARERPLEAASLLKDMIASLTRAESLDPSLDHAGPARLKAVVLLRAPPWPLGPGDVEAAVASAQRAVQRDAAYPPNLITLAQAQSKTDGAGQARATFTKAQQAVASDVSASAADRAQWSHAVEQGLKALQ